MEVTRAWYGLPLPTPSRRSATLADRAAHRVEPMDLGLAGARAVVSGASRGIGLAIAHALAAEGCAVGLLARGAADLELALDDVGQHGALVVGRVVYVTDPVALAAAVDEVAGELGGLDRVVANVGGSVGRNLLDSPATEVAQGFAATFD